MIEIDQESCRSLETALSRMARRCCLKNVIPGHLVVLFANVPQEEDGHGGQSSPGDHGA